MRARGRGRVALPLLFLLLPALQPPADTAADERAARAAAVARARAELRDLDDRLARAPAAWEMQLQRVRLLYFLAIDEEDDLRRAALAVEVARAWLPGGRAEARGGGRGRAPTGPAEERTDGRADGQPAEPTEERAEGRAVAQPATVAPRGGGPAHARVALDGYDGALDVLRGKHAFWPTTRLGYLRRGLGQLDEHLSRHPGHAELRYLRLVSGFYLPGIFGRGDAVREDLLELERRLPEVADQYPPSAFVAMAAFVLEHGPSDEEKRAPLRAALRSAEEALRSAAGGALRSGAPRAFRPAAEAVPPSAEAVPPSAAQGALQSPGEEAPPDV